MSTQPRSHFQVLVIPYWLSDANEPKYAAFMRSGPEESYWQWIAGGGESGETPLQAARRESYEEACIPKSARFTALKSVTSIPVFNFERTGWPDDLDVIPEYAFAVEIHNPALKLSDEHIEYRWLGYEEAMETLRWDSNKTALWELRRRLIRDGHVLSADPASA